MQSFVFLCMTAAVFADKLGYNYRPVGHSNSGLSFTPGSTKQASAQIGDASFQPVSQSDPLNFGGYQTEFYTFTAPEDLFDDPVGLEKIAGSLKKKIRVVFIKSPENNAYENAVLALAKQAAEQRTAIYVLSKQHDISDLAEKFNAVSHNYNRKPEVHFVKYRTAEDGAKAQETIQAQYDSLSGYSQHYNGGVAPALNFVSQATEHADGSIPGSDSVYLPPLKSAR